VPIPIYGIGNGMGFGVTGFSKASIWMLTITMGVSISFMGKGKVQETMVNFAPLMGSCSLVVVTTCSFENL
jgi:hypothetical protein